MRESSKIDRVIEIDIKIYRQIHIWMFRLIDRQIDSKSDGRIER
jgi:hypothetical protein